jgi:hypothetical protein
VYTQVKLPPLSRGETGKISSLPFTRGEGKGITFNTGEFYQRGWFIH